jgi:hypothetical protein
MRLYTEEERRETDSGPPQWPYVDHVRRGLVPKAPIVKQNPGEKDAEFEERRAETWNRHKLALGAIYRGVIEEVASTMRERTANLAREAVIYSKTLARGAIFAIGKRPILRIAFESEETTLIKVSKSFVANPIHRRAIEAFVEMARSNVEKAISEQRYLFQMILNLIYTVSPELTLYTTYPQLPNLPQFSQWEVMSLDTFGTNFAGFDAVNASEVGIDFDAEEGEEEEKEREGTDVTLTDPSNPDGPPKSFLLLHPPIALTMRDVTRPNPKYNREIGGAKRISLLDKTTGETYDAVIKYINTEKSPLDVSEAVYQHAVWQKRPELAPRVYGYGAVNVETIRHIITPPHQEENGTGDTQSEELSIMVMEYFPYTLVNNLDLLTPDDVPKFKAQLELANMTLFEEMRRLHNDPAMRNVFLRVDPETQLVRSFVLADYGKVSNPAAGASAFGRSSGAGMGAAKSALNKWMDVLFLKLAQFSEKWQLYNETVTGPLLRALPRSSNEILKKLEALSKKKVNAQ